MNVQPLSLLTDEERRFVTLLMEELPMKQIAHRLVVSSRTCDRIRVRVQSKLQVQSSIGIAKVVTTAELQERTVTP